MKAAIAILWSVVISTLILVVVLVLISQSNSFRDFLNIKPKEMGQGS